MDGHLMATQKFSRRGLFGLAAAAPFAVSGAAAPRPFPAQRSSLTARMPSDYASIKVGDKITGDGFAGEWTVTKVSR
jgi:hypothetical protein